VDKDYTSKWFDEDGNDKYGPDHRYEIQKLVAIYAYPPYLQWENIDDLTEY
jgi:hypothetical protein